MFMRRLFPMIAHDGEPGAGGSNPPANPPTPPAAPPANPPTPPTPPATPPELPADVQTKLKEYEDLKKAKEKADREALSETDRLKKDAEDARKAARDALAEAVAARHGLPDELASRLVGNTKEELDADAKRLAALLPPKQPNPANTGTPAGGNPPADGKTDIQKKEAELAEAFKKRDPVAQLRLQREIAALRRKPS